MTLLLVVALGAVGAVTRHLLDTRLPLRGVLVVNVVGSLVLGVLTGAALDGGLSADLLRIGGTGFCGGFTTFSTVAVRAAERWLAGEPVLRDLLTGVVLTLLAATVGLLLGLA